ncbi:MAG: hypothetical protein R2847_09240 [Bacteroidia bacterium]
MAGQKYGMHIHFGKCAGNNTVREISRRTVLMCFMIRVLFQRKEELMATHGTKTDIRIGIAAAYEVIMFMGFFCDSSDGIVCKIRLEKRCKRNILYQLGMRYVVTKNMFATINLKTISVLTILNGE